MTNNKHSVKLLNMETDLKNSFLGLRISPALLEAVDKFADSKKFERSEAVRVLLSLALSDRKISGATR